MSDAPAPASGSGGSAPEFLQETLFASSTIRLFGREFVGLRVGKLGLLPQSNASLLTALRNSDQQDLRLARIYGYSYEGNYFKLANPTVFLVYGGGFEVTAGQDPPIALGTAGVEFKDEIFAQDVRMWPADRMDQAVRVDITVGSLQDMLLGPAAPSSNVTAGNTSASGVTLAARLNPVTRIEPPSPWPRPPRK